MMKTFETANPHLAAVLLALVPGAQFLEVDESRPGAELKVIRLGYPADQNERLHACMVEFADCRLTINLALYNRHLNAIRDQLGLRWTNRWWRASETR